MNIRFEANLNRDGIQAAVDSIEAAVRKRFPKVQHIYLEAESIRTNARLIAPDYPSMTDLPPAPR